MPSCAWCLYKRENSLTTTGLPAHMHKHKISWNSRHLPISAYKWPLQTRHCYTKYCTEGTEKCQYPYLHNDDLGVVCLLESLHTCRSIRLLHDLVTWYKITFTGEQVAQWDFQNKGRCIGSEVPLRNLLTSICKRWTNASLNISFNVG